MVNIHGILFADLSVSFIQFIYLFRSKYFQKQENIESNLNIFILLFVPSSKISFSKWF